MSCLRFLRGKLRRKMVAFCLVSSLLLFIYVSLKLLTTHETDAIISGRRSNIRAARDLGVETDDVMQPPLSPQWPPLVGGNKTDLNKVIVPYKVKRQRNMQKLALC